MFVEVSLAAEAQDPSLVQCHVTPIPVTYGGIMDWVALHYNTTSSRPPLVQHSNEQIKAARRAAVSGGIYY